MHRLRIAHGAPDDNYFLPALLLAGNFVVLGGRLSPRPSSPVPAASLATVSPGTPAVLAGVLSDPVSLKSGVAYTLTDDSGSFRVVLWDSNVPEDLRAALDDGVRAAVSGSVTEFNGILQLTASRGRSVMVLD
ncbi:MAG: OB-fold nucleic acid binding domain-containing protein, partial [Kiritimatiellae bacterium]|nr:OB-fold nucleic acid binding domain-containing protein [Kiritimatiellia bacterium]